MILSNGLIDPRFAGAVFDIKAKEKKGTTGIVYPPMELGAYMMRFLTLRLEYMSKYWQRHLDLSRYIDPKRGFFEGDIPDYNRQIDHKLITDGEPKSAVRVLGAGMQSGLASPAADWFRFALDDEELENYPGVKEWLNLAHDRVMSAFAESNVYESFLSCYEELGMFGTCCLGIFEDFQTKIRAHAFTAGEYFLGNDAHGRINAFARQFWKTADAIINEYGWDNCSELIQRAYTAGQRDTYFLIYQIIEPNTNRVNGKDDFSGKAFRSVTWEAQARQDKCLRREGYNDGPILGARWRTTTTADVYGTGPGWDAIGDVKTLYKMVKDGFLGLARIVDPPVQVSGNVNGDINLLPGGITRYDLTTPDAGVKTAYQIQPNLDHLRLWIQDRQAQIKRYFYNDLFLMMLQSPSKDMTAREVAEKANERLLQIGPVIHRTNNELHTPAVMRTLNIGIRQGWIPPPPPILQGRPFKIEYVSLLASAQKLAQATAIEQVAAFTGNIISVNPAAADNIDWDKAVRWYADIKGVPPDLIVPNEKMAQVRQLRAKHQEEMQRAQMAMAATQGAKNLASAQVGGGNALEHALGVEPAQPGQGGNA